MTMSQKIIPVLTVNGNRVLGTMVLPAKKVYTGDETTESIDGVSFPLMKFTLPRRLESGVMESVEFMGSPMTDQEERETMYQHLPGFVSITDSTPTKQGWVIPGRGVAVEPVMDGGIWGKFVAALPTIAP